MQFAIQTKSDKNNFTWIHCAYKERFKTLPKNSLAYRFYSAVILLTCCCEWHQWQ